jgi:hypothetical protein
MLNFPLFFGLFITDFSELRLMDKVQKVFNMCYNIDRHSFFEFGSFDSGGYTYRHKKRKEEFIKWAMELGSGAMKFTPSSIRIGLGKMQGHSISLLLFLQNNESSLK